MRLTRLLSTGVLTIIMIACDTLPSTCECTELFIMKENGNIPESENENYKECDKHYNELPEKIKGEYVNEMKACPAWINYLQLEKKREKEIILSEGHIGKWKNSNDEFMKFIYVFKRNGTWFAEQKMGYRDPVYSNGTWKGTAENLSIMDRGYKTGSARINDDGTILDMSSKIGSITLYKQ